MAAHTRVAVGCNVQVAVDTKRKRIVEPRVTNQIVEMGLLTQTAEPAMEVLGVGKTLKSNATCYRNPGLIVVLIMLIIRDMIKSHKNHQIHCVARYFKSITFFVMAAPYVTPPFCAVAFADALVCPPMFYENPKNPPIPHPSN